MRRTRTESKRTILFFLLIGGIGLVVASDVMQSQPSPLETISRIDGRPLAAVILELENRHGWIITYEDPPWESPDDVEDVTTAVRKDDRFDKKVIVLRNRLFALDYQNLDPTRPGELLSSMLSAYHASGKDDAFRLIHEGGVYHVVPTRSLNRNGIPTERQSLLDVRISIESNKRSVIDMLRLVLDQVSSATGVPVVLATVGGNLLDRTLVQGGVTDEVARDVLVDTLAATGRKLSWRLLCSAGSPKQCAFNLHAVAVQK